MLSKHLLTSSLIFFTGTMVFSVFNYLYNTFMGRFLGPADYSILGSLLAFISIVTIPTNAVATIAMRFAAHYHARGQDSAIHTFLRQLTKRLGLVGLAGTLLLAAVSLPLSSFLHLPSPVPALLIAPVIIFAILLPLNRGILQGLQRFFDAIVNQNIDPLLKFSLGLLFVKLGLGINGAIIAISIGAFVAYLASYLPLRSVLRHRPSRVASIPSEVKQYSALALVAFLLATLLMNVDILLVKHFLPPHQAGLYAALSTMGKIVLFVTTPIVSVMFPMISDLQGRNKKHYQILIQSFLLVTLIGTAVVTSYYLFPQFVVKILYGSAYASVAPLLGFFGVTMLLYSLINLWVNYFLSIGDRVFVWLLGLSVGVEIVLLSLRHDSFSLVIQGLLLAMVVGFVALTGYYLYLKRARILESLPVKPFSITPSA